MKSRNPEAQVTRPAIAQLGNRALAGKGARSLNCINQAKSRARHGLLRWGLILLVGGGLLMPSLTGQDSSRRMLLSAPRTVVAGSRVNLVLCQVNSSANSVVGSFPSRLDGILIYENKSHAVRLTLNGPPDEPSVSIPPAGFRQREYSLDLPLADVDRMILEIPSLAVSPAVLTFQKTVAAPSAASSRGQPTDQARSGLEPAASRGLRTNRFDAYDYFKRHFFPYDPFYFVAGPDSPNAKFQISFKYQLLNSEGPLAARAPTLKGFHLAYSQTSLWDWNEPSAPFLDSSYKPEVLYSLEQVDGGRWAKWIRLDLQCGLQHESNGRDGLASRSLNVAYLRPALWLGDPEGLFFSLTPRAWVYVGSLSDNPDLTFYRGYVDVRATGGWTDGLQLSSTVRVGDEASRGSLQLDLTYPMSRLLTRSFSLYLHAQYFTGYGESLLLYKERSTAYRLGFSLYR